MHRHCALSTQLLSFSIYAIYHASSFAPYSAAFYGMTMYRKGFRYDMITEGKPHLLGLVMRIHPGSVYKSMRGDL